MPPKRGHGQSSPSPGPPRKKALNGSSQASFPLGDLPSSFVARLTPLLSDQDHLAMRNVSRSAHTLLTCDRTSLRIEGRYLDGDMKVQPNWWHTRADPKHMRYTATINGRSLCVTHPLLKNAYPPRFANGVAAAVDIYKNEIASFHFRGEDKLTNGYRWSGYLVPPPIIFSRTLMRHLQSLANLRAVHITHAYPPAGMQLDQPLELFIHGKTQLLELSAFSNIQHLAVYGDAVSKIQGRTGYSYIEHYRERFLAAKPTETTTNRDCQAIRRDELSMEWICESTKLNCRFDYALPEWVDGWDNKVTRKLLDVDWHGHKFGTLTFAGIRLDSEADLNTYKTLADRTNFARLCFSPLAGSDATRFARLLSDTGASEARP